MSLTPEQIAEDWRQNELGVRVDGHCPYDEATLRVDLVRGGFACPCCFSHFKTIDKEHAYDRQP